MNRHCIGLAALLAFGLLGPQASGQPSFLKPVNFRGEVLPLDLPQPFGGVYCDSRGRVWILRGEPDDRAIWLARPDGETHGPLGLRRLDNPQLAEHRASGRVYALGRDPAEGAISRVFVLDDVFGPRLCGWFAGPEPTAFAIDRRGRAWIARTDEDSCWLHRLSLPGEDHGPNDPLSVEAATRLPVRPSGMVGDAKGRLVFWDDDEVWRWSPDAGAPEALFLVPSRDANRLARIQRVVPCPFDAPGRGLIVALRHFDSAGHYMAASAHFGVAGQIEEKPFVTKLGRTWLDKEFILLAVSAGRRGELAFLSRSRVGELPKFRLDRVRQVAREGVPGSLHARLESHRIVIEGWGRPGRARPFQLGMSPTRAQGGLFRGHLVDLVPSAATYIAIRNGLRSPNPKPFAHTSEDGHFSVEVPVPEDWPEDRPIHLQALIKDPMAANGAFMVSNVTVIAPAESESGRPWAIEPPTTGIRDR